MPSLDRVDARTRLKPRRDPYWQRLAQGRYVGFRRMTPSSLGTWIARLYDGEKYQHEALGDFALLAERDRFDAARGAAEAWFRHLDLGGATSRVTVKAACEAYATKLEQEKSPATAKDARGRFSRLVYEDPLASVDLKKLAPRHLAEWKARVLGKGGALGSFNRNATALRAALNLAYKRRDVATDHAWRDELVPFENADGRRELYLKPAARSKLLTKATPEAQRFIRTLLLLPLRPGDVAKLKVEHFDRHHSILTVPTGKTSTRVIPLSKDATAHFAACARDKLPGAFLVSRDRGGPWTKSEWRDAVQEARAAARLPESTVAYTLRHSVITDLVVGGLDLFTVAKLSGTSIEMVEKHYGHLQREHARKALERLKVL